MSASQHLRDAATLGLYPSSATKSQLTARRILAAMDRASAVTSVSDATFASGTANAASTLNSKSVTAALILPTDPLIRPIGAQVTFNGSGSPYTQALGYKLANGLIGKGGFGYAFCTDAPAIDWAAFTNGNKHRLQVNGQWMSEYAPTNDSSLRYVKATFGSTIDREIKLYCGYDATFTGFNVALGYRIWAAPRRGPTGVFWGDSYSEGAWQTTASGTLNVQLSEELGFEIAASGIGGQGCVKADTTYNKTFVDRANAGDFTTLGQQDLYIIYNSLNDFNQTAATVQANWQTVITRLMADQPNALIYGFAGFQASAYAVDASHTAAFINAFNAVKDSSRMACADMSVAPSPLITVSGTDRNDVSPGTGAINIGGDNIHPSQPVGVTYMAKRIASGVRAFAKTVAA